MLVMQLTTHVSFRIKLKFGSEYRSRIILFVLLIVFIYINTVHPLYIIDSNTFLVQRANDIYLNYIQLFDQYKL